MKITKGFFSRVCNARAHVKCHHLARRMGELKVPVAWLQRKAMDEGDN
ncbi:MAG: hypothetical protein PVJ38_02395 [Candidatus Bathyarchaeota archaeon]